MTKFYEVIVEVANEENLIKWCDNENRISKNIWKFYAHGNSKSTETSAIRSVKSDVRCITNNFKIVSVRELDKSEFPW